ncbi:hypothetical protein G6F58_013172 [Rhizopus delemar]|nr:hypothetical protein G6F58_013172 [Rhizopus delemar]
MYNSLTGITPWYFDRRTEWYDAPSFSGDPGYKDAYRNLLRQKRFGLDASNTSRCDTQAGAFTLDYGLSYSDEDIAPGSSGPVMHDDLVNNRFLRNAARKEYSAVASLKWQPDEHWELLAGGRESGAAEAVVCNVTPGQLYGQLLPDAPEPVRQRAAGYR